MIRFEEDDRIAVLTIDRPEARNAINATVAQGIEDGIDRLEGDDNLLVGILTGVPPVFSAGADLRQVSAGTGDSLRTARGGFGGLVSRERVKPLLAAVNGAALAGGCELALACDLIVAATDARFGLPEVKRSLVASGGGLFRAPRALPRNVAMELAMTGDSISAERAFHFGLVNVLCEPGEALAKAKELAGRLIANAPLAVRAARRVVLESHGVSDDRAWEISAAAYETVRHTEDYQEGPLAFLEKRSPRWKGR
jgi:enoyl-CoA hydratase